MNRSTSVECWYECDPSKHLKYHAAMEQCAYPASFADVVQEYEKLFGAAVHTQLNRLGEYLEQQDEA